MHKQHMYFSLYFLSICLIFLTILRAVIYNEDTIIEDK